ncbi:NCS cytosine-purine permease [Agrocybe pediades]|nr:NCS cytosine-purine permease [Agrocybe pediades]
MTSKGDLYKSAEGDIEVQVIGAEKGALNDTSSSNEGGIQEIPKHSWTWNKLATWGVEERGIVPVPPEEQTDTQYSKMTFVFFSSNFTILTFSMGTTGPVVFQLGLRDACLVVFISNLVCAVIPAYIATWGAQLGMRQMALGRYTFGYYGMIVPCFLNLLGVIGFAVLNCILGGQALASVTDGRLSWTVGIVIFSIMSVVVSFFGYRFLHWYERLAWFPVLVATVIALGEGWKNLGNFPPPVPVTSTSVLGFLAVQAGFTILWAGYAADYGTYLDPRRPKSSWKIFGCAYIGLFVPTVLMECVGIAFATATPFVPAWNDAFAGGGNLGGLLNAVFQPLGNFGKFLVVIMSLSVSPNLCSIFYSASFNYQVIIPRLMIVPRYVFTIVTAAIVLPIAIVGAHKLDAAITNVLSLLGYWISAFVSAVILEHLYFRSGNFRNYDRQAWNDPRRLPWGLGALGSSVLAFGLVIPCMSQVWFTGPLAQVTGDLGFEVALVLTAILYIPMRYLEISLQGQV